MRHGAAAAGGRLAGRAAGSHNQTGTEGRRRIKLLVTLERDETGMIVAECPAIPGCVSQGKTEDEAIANIREAIAAGIEARAANGMPVTVAIREVEVQV